MKKGVNRVIVLGNLGADPEIRYTADGTACASFSVAVSESRKDKSTGEQKEVTEWIRCVAWKKLAEIIEQYVKKGSKVYLEGKLQTRSWEQDGSKRYATEVIVDELQMLDGKKESEKGDSSRIGGREEQVRNALNYIQPKNTHKPSAPPVDDDPFGDSQIPFNQVAR